jgi:hypothetical protein
VDEGGAIGAAGALAGAITSAGATGAGAIGAGARGAGAGGAGAGAGGAGATVGLGAASLLIELVALETAVTGAGV